MTGLLKKLFVHPIKRYIAAAVTATAFCVVSLFTRGHDSFVQIDDAVSIGGAVSFLLGLLSMVSHFGAFDTFNYGFRRIGGRRNEDYYEYTSRKTDERSRQELTFMPFITVGVLLIAAGLVLIRIGG